MLGFSVEASRAQREERKNARFRDRGGYEISASILLLLSLTCAIRVFVRSEHNPLLDKLLAGATSQNSSTNETIPSISNTTDTENACPPVHQRNAASINLKAATAVTRQSKSTKLKGQTRKSGAKRNTNKKMNVHNETKVSQSSSRKHDVKPADITREQPESPATGAVGDVEFTHSLMTSSMQQRQFTWVELRD